MTYSLSNSPGWIIKDDPDSIRERYEREEMEDDASVLRAEQEREDPWEDEEETN